MSPEKKKYADLIVDFPGSAQETYTYSLEANHHVKIGQVVEIPFGKKTKEIYTEENGLSRCWLYGDSVMGSVDGYLANSSSFGRVVLVDAEGVALKNLEVEKVINERIIKRTQGTTKIQSNGWFSYLENSEK